MFPQDLWESMMKFGFDNVKLTHKKNSNRMADHIITSNRHTK